MQLIEPEPGVLDVADDECLQRMGLGTPDVPATVAQLRERGVEFVASKGVEADQRGALTRTAMGSVMFELVHEADFMWNEIKTVEERISTARTFRVFPGEGVHSEALAALTLKLHQMGYRGDYSFEVFKDDYQQMPLETVAQRARASALWLGEGVLRR